MVGWCSRGGCLVDPFKDGADWLVVKLTGGLLELETEVCGDVLIGVRTGRVGVVDFDVVDDGVPKGCPGKKVAALGLSTDAEA